MSSFDRITAPATPAMRAIVRLTQRPPMAWWLEPVRFPAERHATPNRNVDEEQHQRRGRQEHPDLPVCTRPWTAERIVSRAEKRARRWLGQSASTSPCRRRSRAARGSPTSRSHEARACRRCRPATRASMEATYGPGAGVASGASYRPGPVARSVRSCSLPSGPRTAARTTACARGSPDGVSPSTTRCAPSDRSTTDTRSARSVTGRPSHRAVCSQRGLNPRQRRNPLDHDDRRSAV